MRGGRRIPSLVLIALSVAGAAATGADAAGRTASVLPGAPRTPAGGFAGPYVHGHAARFEVGAAVVDFSPPLRGSAPGGDGSDCASAASFGGARRFAFEEPYVDLKHDGHFDSGDPFAACNGNGRWDGNLLGGGTNTPRFYDHVADPATARALVVASGDQTIAGEVGGQEGVLHVFQQHD